VNMGKGNRKWILPKRKKRTTLISYQSAKSMREASNVMGRGGNGRGKEDGSLCIFRKKRHLSGGVSAWQPCVSGMKVNRTGDQAKKSGHFDWVGQRRKAGKFGGG